jgi:hypothetical protein
LLTDVASWVGVVAGISEADHSLCVSSRSLLCQLYISRYSPTVWKKLSETL